MSEREPLEVEPPERPEWAFSLLPPSGWISGPLSYGFLERPEYFNFEPLLDLTDHYTRASFTVAGRVVHPEGSVQDWLRALANASNLLAEWERETAVGTLPALLAGGTWSMPSGPWRGRMLCVECGGCLYRMVGAAPEHLWTEVEGAVEQLTSGFRPAVLRDRLLRLFPTEPMLEGTPAGEHGAPPAAAQPVPSERRQPDSPAWWKRALELEEADRLQEAEKVLLDAIDHLGVCAQIAHLHELRMERLLAAGDVEGAKAAGECAIDWLHRYAASATSGGEGAALSLERDHGVAAIRSRLSGLG